MTTATPKPRVTSPPEKESAAERLLEKVIANDEHLKAYCERKQRHSEDHEPFGSFSVGIGLPLPQYKKKFRK